MLAASVQAAMERGATDLVTVSTVGILRLLKRMGVHVRPAGEARSIDGAGVIALWIELDAQTCSALGLANRAAINNLTTVGSPTETNFA
jgi:acyl homoserine lactone synthase